MKSNLTLREFYSRITSAQANVEEAKRDYERCVLEAIGIAEREGSLAQEAEELGWSLDDAMSFSVAGTVFVRITEAGGSLSIDGEVQPSEFVDKAKQAMGKKGGVSGLIYTPVNMYCLICSATDTEPTLTGAMGYINKTWPKPEKREAEDKMSDDLEAVYNRATGQTADGKVRKAVPLTDRSIEVINKLYALAHQDELVS